MFLDFFYFLLLFSINISNTTCSTRDNCVCRLNWDNSLYSIFHSSIDEHRLQPTHVPLTIYKVFQPVPDGILIFFDPLKNPIISIFITKHSRPRMYRKKGNQNSLQKLIIRLIKFTIKSQKSPIFYNKIHL